MNKLPFSNVLWFASSGAPEFGKELLKVGYVFFQKRFKKGVCLLMMQTRGRSAVHMTDISRAMTER